jgi:hypothetical protein
MLTGMKILFLVSGLRAVLNVKPRPLNKRPGELFHTNFNSPLVVSTDKLFYTGILSIKEGTPGIEGTDRVFQIKEQPHKNFLPASLLFPGIILLFKW